MRKFFSTPAGRVVAIVLCVVALAVGGYSVWANFSPNAAAAAANSPLFVNAETGYAFHVKLTPGMTIPVECPDTGKATGYEAELCYWTKDGHPKDDPTAVVLNEAKGASGPTFCPDCGRLVVFRNPMAVEGHRPPPTEAQYHAREASR